MSFDRIEDMELRQSAADEEYDVLFVYEYNFGAVDVVLLVKGFDKMSVSEQIVHESVVDTLKRPQQ